MDLCSTLLPKTLTFITTYRCTAACTQCCFESSPKVKGRLSRDEMMRALHDVKERFPSLRVVVFTGGETTLLKDDLVAMIAEATSLGLVTRIVSNGSWGKTKATAVRMAGKLAGAGLCELNISTGKDHQDWVPHESVVNAAEAAFNAGVLTLLTVEADTAESEKLSALTRDPTIKRLRDRGLLLQSNSWMSFKDTGEEREHVLHTDRRATPCEQIHNNIAITPYGEVSACCGLTLEHIPEMKLGTIAEGVSDTYLRQRDDFLKYWLRMDGPAEIVRKVMGQERADELLSGSVHICHDCAVLHKNPEVRKRITATYEQFVPEVMSRYALASAVDQIVEQQGA
ncbi:radical SAM/SPASM domain-containing protein [Xanthomonas albilineans]|uniref:radical SAM/SPASM domain-containing protein n=1 Tax=Xanthomonas albilineans TaxID=29447 RepID=UPI0027D959C1|nr:radical SAM/SPASM domain-containing protein [Xanthomonas albilineans]